jgi:hypothetical protein
MTRNLENAPISAGGAGQIPDLNAINDMPLSEPYSAKKTCNSPVSAGGAGQIPLANAINDKFQSVSTIGIHHLSSHTGDAAQFPQANAINVGSHHVPPIRIHIHSGYAGGAAQFPQAHPINDKARPLEGTIRSLANVPISAGGAGQFPDPNAINDMSLATNINCPLDHSGSQAQLLQAHSASANPRPLVACAGPYSAFNLSLDKHHATIESEKLAWRLLMVPIDRFIDDEVTTRIKKADAWTTPIDQRQKQFAISALKNADPPRSVGTSDDTFDMDRSETKGIYRGDYDNERTTAISVTTLPMVQMKMTLMLTSPWATARKAPLPQQPHIILLNSPPLGGRWMTYRTGSR